MKTLIVFACLLGAAIGASINYGDCQWIYGGATQMKYCPDGFVGTGACGNKGQSRCNGQAFGIKCCRIVSGSGKGQCEIYGGGNGGHVTCPFRTQVFGMCGSLDMGRCDQSGSRQTTSAQCCDSGLTVTTNCAWQHAGNQGQVLECSGNQVLAGICGSQTMAKCSGNVHGINCCDYV